MLISKLFSRSSLFSKLPYSFSVANEPGFLEMVREYMDKAGVAAGIPEDRMNFLKSPDFSLKLTIPFRTGTINIYIQMQALFKSFKPIESNIKHTDYPPREEPGTPIASISKKFKHSLHS